MNTCLKMSKSVDWILTRLPSTTQPNNQELWYGLPFHLIMGHCKLDIKPWAPYILEMRRGDSLVYGVEVPFRGLQLNRIHNSPFYCVHLHFSDW
ncbi:hypothetical protein TNCV_2041291 [Trichonephila clavipes]|nr:hypothetical protein TNCV_2041291 [Trichonephila clavipes]